MTTVGEFIQILRNLYDGDAWHGPTIKTILSRVDESHQDARIGEGHSIAEIVFHMVAWRKFVIARLSGDDQFDINDQNNFPDGKWEDAIDQLEKSQNELVQALGKFEESKLCEIVPTRKDTFHKVLHGIIHHDLYHLGQVSLLTKLASP